MPLDETDRSHLIQLGRQCKASGYPLNDLKPWFNNMNPTWFPTVEAICIQDEEWQDLGVPPLVRWARSFPVKVLMTAEPAKLREIEQTLLEGWNQG